LQRSLVGGLPSYPLAGASLMLMGNSKLWGFRIVKVDLYRTSQEALRELLKQQRKGDRVDANDRCGAAWEAAVIRRKYESGDRRLDVLELIDVAADGVVTCP
jgi:hypothetical protein